MAGASYSSCAPVQPHAAAKLTTTDGTAATIAQWPQSGDKLPDGSTVTVLAFVTAHDVSTHDAAGIVRSATFKVSGGTMAQVGATTAIASHADAGAAAWAATIDTDGSAIRVRVTGAGGSTIRWIACSTGAFVSP